MRPAGREKAEKRKKPRAHARILTLPVSPLLPLAAIAFSLGCSERSAHDSAPHSPAPSAAVSSSSPELALPDIAGRGTFLYQVRDAATGAPIPAKITFVGVGPTHTPSFTTTDTPLDRGRAIAAFNKVLTLSGEGRIDVPPGTYDIYVSRGPEWSLVVRPGFVVGTEEVLLDAKLTHQIDTPGWVSGDFHVHAAPSFDSKVPLRARVFEFAAEGVDVIASTDHNVVADYGPIILELNAADFITSIHGDEVTTKDWGHFGALPLPIDTKMTNGGAPQAKGRTPTQIFHDVRALSKDALVTVNHPRFDRGLGYFTTAQLDRDKLTFGRKGASLDFDAIEVLNGYEHADIGQVDTVFEDWFALLKRGHLVAATGNSDTHHLDYSLAGYPRNYVPVADDEPSHIKPDDIAAAVKGKRSFFTTGPFLQLTVNGARTGDLVKADHARVTAHVIVRAADWIPTDTLTLYVGGKVGATRALDAKKGATRFDDDIVLDIEGMGDTFVVARVSSNAVLPVVVGDGDKHRLSPIAVTNPVFVDVDGDGQYLGASVR